MDVKAMGFKHAVDAGESKGGVVTREHALAADDKFAGTYTIFPAIQITLDKDIALGRALDGRALSVAT